MKWLIKTATLFLLAMAFLPINGNTFADDGSERPGVNMAVAATKLAEILPAELKQKMMFSYDDPERLNWHFIPRDRNGIVLWDLSGESRKAADDDEPDFL